MYNYISILWPIIQLTVLVTIECHDFKGFDDTVMFAIDWPGPLEEPGNYENHESLVVTTHNKEKYKCMIPNLITKETEPMLPYNGPNPLDLVSELFTSPACSYRIETYWTYELCHGNYIKQYHEEREGKTLKVQEYVLGRWTKQQTADLQTKLAEAERSGEKFKHKKIDGLNLPYLELEMNDGTPCDLNDDEPRLTKVLYVCYAHGKNDVYTVKETATCNYEVVILTPALCAHPSFKLQETTENAIECFPDNPMTPVKPRSLLAMEFERLKTMYQKINSMPLNDIPTSGNDQYTVMKAVVAIDPKDGTMKLMSKEYITPKQPTDGQSITFKTDTNEVPTQEKKYVGSTPKDTLPIRDFLAGKYCLTGGSGWWRYEFCYGRFVRQFHKDKNGETSVILGYFDEKLHKEWLEKNPTLRPKERSERYSLTHFYQGGTHCEKTGRKRQTEVKLKCLLHPASQTAVQIFLMEPRTCEYVLGVESPLICDILQKADEYGLVPIQGATDGEGVLLGNAIIEDVELRFEND